MGDFNFELDHIGIAVESLESGKQFYEALGLSCASKEEVTSESVNVGFFPLGNRVNLELLEATQEGSAIAKYIEKRGPGIHHICLRVQNLDQLVSDLKEKGVRLITDAPKIGAHNCRVIFVHPKSTGGVLVELSEPQNQIQGDS